MASLLPPAHLAEDAASVWTSVVTAHPRPELLDAMRLEAFCLAVATLRAAHQAITDKGLTVVDDRGQVVKNPALAAARDAQEQVRRWGTEFARPHPPKRRRGTMYDATTASISAAEHLKDAQFRGACEAVKTLAWLIDEAQRAGVEELRKASFGAIPAYLRGCADLRITPASVPEVERRPKRRGAGRLQAIRGGITGAAG
ncbi:Phage terminase, small subunit [Actinomyces bovis]|uniref:Phage terminase, small subunit n=1 Tax=Actinomyces bovis TaxID=1658 RepID=A0ABY1VNV0_9ACTO|nr:P27 family phage terminase small subunit [Actinomyces bovis]SPT53789.1 Phage terminase, small subunit [Actinomyces bovis]VEG53141.1 Phage terminase, small subunit [Actinomyces israelii]